MNLKLYQKIYLVTNEQCIRLTVPNARFQRYLRGQTTVLLPAEHCALSLIKCPAVQYNLRAKYTIIVVIFPFFSRRLRPEVCHPQADDCLPAEHRPNVRFLSLVFPCVRVYCNNRRTEYLFILCVRVYLIITLEVNIYARHTT